MDLSSTLVVDEPGCTRLRGRPCGAGSSQADRLVALRQAVPWFSVPVDSSGRFRLVPFSKVGCGAQASLSLVLGKVDMIDKPRLVLFQLDVKPCVLRICAGLLTFAR